MHGNPPPVVVLAHGCFDLLHLGHIRHLQAARALGDRLVVSVTADPHVRKGAGRPRFTAAQRVEALKGLDCVNDAFINDTPDAVAAINHIRPNIYVKGADYAGVRDVGLAREVAALEAIGGHFQVTSTEKWSSSRILNGEQFPEQTIAYLDQARSRGYRDQIAAAFERADKLKIAFVGETILDEYIYVSALGKPSKEFILATVATHSESYHGGVMAAAEHGEWPLCEVVTGSQVIRKTRYVDTDFTRKIFEVYNQRQIDLAPDQREMFHVKLKSIIRDSDVIVVLDFGHGLMADIERNLVEKSRFLAVNAQTNAGNCGFNPVTKYRNVDYVCVDEPEARLATGMQNEPLRTVMDDLYRRMDRVFGNLVVTHGRYGCAFCGPTNRGDKIPPFATHGLDTMGAGDAFLAVTAPLIAAGLDLEAAAFVGNVAGAIKVSIVGHRRHVGREELMQTVDGLLK